MHPTFPFVGVSPPGGQMACDLEVLVDGEVLMVKEDIISPFCGKLDTMNDRSPITVSLKTKRIALRDFPGGPEVFELVERLCYSHGSIEITPTNTCILCFAAQFFEMSGDLNKDLVALTEASLEGIPNWTSFEMLTALRQCRVYFPLSDSCGVFERVLKSLLGRVNSAGDGIPSDSSPESSRFRFSFDTRSTTSTKNSSSSCSHKPWWLEDLAIFRVDAIGKIVHTMMSLKMDHQFISRFLFYYLKTRCSVSSPDEKLKIIETVVNLLHSLDRSSVLSKGLFEILRLSSSSNVSTCTRDLLDDMIGFNLDNGTLDNMLIPAPAGIDALYDVDQVLRFLKCFLRQSGSSSLTRLKKVGSLMDLYLAETAPDPGLKPRKFVSLAMALPNSARESFDAIYRAVNMYIEVHPDLLEEEKIMICCALDYRKLSSESCKHLARNAKMPPWTVIKALMFQQSKLRGLLQNSSDYSFPRSSPCGERKSLRCREQTVLYAKRISVSAESEKLKARLEGMQWKVTHLEDVCKQMQAQVRNVSKTGVATRRSSRFLPSLCS